MHKAKINIPLILYGSFLIVCIALFVYVRMRHKDIAFERDEGEYAYAAQEILRGKIPYKDFYNMKTPLVYYSFALLFKLFGDSVHTVKISLLFVNLISAFFIFLTARKLFGRDTGLTASGIFLLFCLSYSAQGWTANAEHFVVLFASISLFFLTSDISRWTLDVGKTPILTPDIGRRTLDVLKTPTLQRLKSNVKRQHFNLFFSGVFMMLAFLCKQQAIGLLIFPIIWLISCQLSAVNSRSDLNRSTFIDYRSSFLNFLIYCAGCAVPFTILLFYLWSNGALSDSYYLCIQYAQAYGSIYQTFGEIINFHNIFNDNKWFWMAVLGYFFMIMTGKVLEKYAGFLFLLFFCCFYSVSLGFLFRPHYFQLIFPASAMMAAFFIVRLSTKPYLPVLCLSAAFYFMIDEQENYLCKASPDGVCRKMYPIDNFTAIRDLAFELPDHISDKSKPICVFGHEPQMFYYSHLQSASGFIYMYPMFENQPYAEKMSFKFIDEVEKNNPNTLVYITYTVPNDCEIVLAKYLKKWFFKYSENYHLIGQLYINKDGTGTTEWQVAGSQKLNPKTGTVALIYQK